jgi:hypothetical protein
LNSHGGKTVAPPKKDLNTVRREIAFYASLGGKSYKVNKSDNIVHFLHLGQIEEYFKSSSNMPLLVNTKYDLFLSNTYYDLIEKETGKQRVSTPDESLEIYIQEYIDTGFILETGIVTEEDL